ncbi:gluconate 2-dehydrogenase subunit 3 family protein [Arhodomonas aquaeolei]|uniref:gluconate 2-dehydrogenase subunit 3 family protein n=1 Tax=Arhodomonas aquaeolei TaxID=2369 RepID=UPI002168E6BD|nr:gluconate 2-dehydrogenase subunit 3 family protein [Arhodomonas aquaeolei]MCS4505973.1 gluconate 2-dehydrogenase subunit 3 family protein [Arhodomonas aquaeolei]
MPLDRRTFLKGAASGAVLFTVGGVPAWLTPREARAEGADLRTLTPAQARALAAYGEVLLPGADEAGLAHYLDAQLSVDPADSLLMIRYLDVPAPWDGFYTGVAHGLDALAQRRHDCPFAELSADAAHDLAGVIAGGEVAEWAGPPAGFAHFVLRADAVDLVYGRPEGFDALDVPYMAHIDPEAVA